MPLHRRGPGPENAPDEGPSETVPIYRRLRPCRAPRARRGGGARLALLLDHAPASLERPWTAML
eukprot:scaffold5572_cov390-Prasinococcus_capsulatus_cf.AAC.13